MSAGSAFLRAWQALLAMVLMVVLAGPALAQLPVPTLSSPVTDRTGTLDASQRQRLAQRIVALQASKGAQLAVLIVPTTGDEPIEQYATRVFEAWRLGRNAVDDGVLLVVAKDDRTLRIEVGYGLEGAIPDAVAARLIREQIVPHLSRGDFAGGITAGVERLAGLIEGESLPAPPTARAAQDDDTDRLLASPLAFVALALLQVAPWLAAPLVGVILFFVTGSLWLAGGGALLALVIGMLMRLARASGYHGASRDGRIRSRDRALPGLGRGGGFGGFGGGFGGGGGRSGGGGASGRW